MFGLPIRLDLPLRLGLVWLIGCLIAVSLSPAFIVVAYFSIPPMALATAVVVGFAPSIIRHPTLWSVTAVATGLIIGCIWMGRAGILSLIVSLPAALLFMASIHIWKPNSVK